MPPIILNVIDLTRLNLFNENLTRFLQCPNHCYKLIRKTLFQYGLLLLFEISKLEAILSVFASFLNIFVRKCDKLFKGSGFVTVCD